MTHYPKSPVAARPRALTNFPVNHLAALGIFTASSTTDFTLKKGRCVALSRQIAENTPHRRAGQHNPFLLRPIPLKTRIRTRVIWGAIPPRALLDDIPACAITL
ncbi:MAG: hypothetical protein WAT09_11980 [Paracoccaceae bacterium]